MKMLFVGKHLKNFIQLNAELVRKVTIMRFEELLALGAPWVQITIARLQRIGDGDHFSSGSASKEVNP